MNCLRRSHLNLPYRLPRPAARALVIAALAMVASGVAAPPARAAEDHWQPGYHAAGPDDRVTALGTWRGQLVAAGGFTALGSVPARGIAAWDGATWRALGEGVGPVEYDLAPRCVAEFQGDLVVGGRMLAASGAGPDAVLRWDGSAWSTMGGGLHGAVSALLPFHGRLYAAGSFAVGPDSTSVLAEWNGTAWRVIRGGQTIPPGEGYCLAEFRDSLYVGGRFLSYPGPLSPSPLWRWDGANGFTGVTALGGEVYALAAFQDRLYAGGELVLNGVYARDVLAAWDGAAWSRPGGGVRYRSSHSDVLVIGEVRALREIAGRLFVTGQFDSAGGQAAGSLAAFDGHAWEAWPPVIGTDLQGGGRALAEWGGRPVVGGYLGPLGEAAINHLATWSAGGWEPLVTPGLGADREVNALVRWRGRLLAGGNFTALGGRRVGGLAERVGDDWIRFQATPADTMRFARVEVILPVGDSLVVIGVPGPSFTGYGQVSRAWLWDGVRWHDTGLSQTFRLGGAAVRWRGHFVLATDGLVTLDGVGIGQADDYVAALAVYHDRLIACGNFRHIGDVAYDFIAAWDGADWRPLNYGLGGSATCMTVFEDELVVGGTFQVVDGQLVRSIARWNGARWAQLGTGFGVEPPGRMDPHGDSVARLMALVPWGNRLLALGHFNEADGPPAANLAAWDGLFWHALEAGTGLEPLAAQADAGGLWVGGFFSQAGGYPATCLARWLGPAPGGESPVSGLAAAPAADGGGIEVRWSMARLDGIQGFDLERRVNEGAWQSVEDEPQPPRLGETRVLDAGVRPGPFERVRYRVILRRLGGDRYVAPGEAELAWPLVPPAAPLLGAPEPSPFTTSTTIPFALPAAGEARVEIFDVGGRRVTTLAAGRLAAGLQRVTWDGRTEAGRSAPAGVYFVQLTTGGRAVSRRVVRGGVAR